MSEFKVDAMMFISAEEVRGDLGVGALAWNDRLAVINLALKRAAKAWGVTGRMVTGHAYGDGQGFHMIGAITESACKQNPTCHPATLYISGPAPKPSAEERIQKALEIASTGGIDHGKPNDPGHPRCTTCAMARILRGEETR